jgi:hypothetical protein
MEVSCSCNSWSPATAGDRDNLSLRQLPPPATAGDGGVSFAGYSCPPTTALEEIRVKGAGKSCYQARSFVLVTAVLHPAAGDGGKLSRLQLSFNRQLEMEKA